MAGRCEATVISPEPMTMVYVGICTDSVHAATATAFTHCGALLTVRHPAGAMTVQATRALSLGWSMVGSQKRARLGQSSANAERRPRAFVPMKKPSVGEPE